LVRKYGQEFYNVLEQAAEKYYASASSVDASINR
jgi:hypothetical protein